MKIAILILAHKSPLLLKRLIHTLDDSRFDIFVHVDAKANITDFAFETYSLKYSKLFVVPDRIKAYWGDISLSDTMIQLYRCAIANDSYDWFITLSGEDYPVQNNNDICTQLSQQGEDYIRMSPCDTGHVRYYRFRKIPYKSLRRIIRKSLSLLGIQKKPYLVINDKKWIVCISSQWHALTQESILHILSIYDQYPMIRRYFKFSHAPDELIIPTILYNAPPHPGYTDVHFYSERLPFEERAAIHFLKHQQENSSSVKVLDEASYQEIISSQKLFIRKVQLGISTSLLNRLDQHRNNK